MINKFLNEFEINDIETFQHCERVACIAYAFGQSLELSPDICSKLYYIGFLHDIGKVQKFVPTTIELGTKEVDISKVYPIFSYKIVQNIKSTDIDVQYIADKILQHNENFDGSGEPYGLSKNSIHLLSMIVHLCDFYDTQRTNGKTHDEATILIRENVNIMFPKKMITPFIKTLINTEDIQFDYTKG